VRGIPSAARHGVYSDEGSMPADSRHPAGDTQSTHIRSLSDDYNFMAQSAAKAFPAASGGALAALIGRISSQKSSSLNITISTLSLLLSELFASREHKIADSMSVCLEF
jgi:hypothetical protein